MKRYLFKSQRTTTLRKGAIPSTCIHSTSRSEIHLPREIWLAICNLLGRLDRRAISLTCHTLWSLVHKSAPFVVLQLCSDRFAEYSSMRQYRRVLSVAKEIYCLPTKGTSQATWHRSSDRLSITCISFRFILSSLYNSSSLQTLALCRLKVVPAHQQLILSIPTLRTLIMQLSEFIPTSMALPPSSITTLNLGEQEQAATRYTLTLVANSLETLQLSSGMYHFLADIPLPRLTSLKSPSIPKTMAFLSSLSTLTNLTISIIGDFRLDIDIDPTVLPNLHYLCTWWTLGALLIAGRPVRIFRLSGNMTMPGDLLTRLAGYVSHLAAAASQLEELQLQVETPVCETIELLTEYFPHITRLHLWTWGSERPALHLDILDEGMGSVQQDKGQHPSLKEVVIAFPPERQNRGAYLLWRSPEWVLPRAECEKMFEMIVKRCAVVEVVRIGYLLPGVDEKDVPTEWVTEMQKAKDGTWVERN